MTMLPLYYILIIHALNIIKYGSCYTSCGLNATNIVDGNVDGEAFAQFSNLALI